jgi:hypothetical protein
MIEHISDNFESHSFEERITYFKKTAFEMLNKGVPVEDFQRAIPNLKKQELYEAVRGVEDAIAEFESCKINLIFIVESINNAQDLFFFLKEEDRRIYDFCNELWLKCRIVMYSSPEPEIIKPYVIKKYIQSARDGDMMFFCFELTDVLKKPDFDFHKTFLFQTDKDGNIDDNLIGIKVCTESRKTIEKLVKNWEKEHIEFSIKDNIKESQYGILPEGYFKKREQKKCVN